MAPFRIGALLSAGVMLVVLAPGLAPPAAGQAPARAADSSAFESRIAPLLARRCLECHSGSSKQGGLDLTRRDAALAGGARGPALVRGRPEASLLWKRVAADQMPPGRPLPAAEKRILKEWIAGGAAWGSGPVDPLRYSSDRRAGYDWWSLQPVRAAPPPAVKAKAWPVNAIDRFILAKLEAEGLRPSPPASRGALIRRVTYDLTGLPPTPEEVEAFLVDRAPGAYERVVDRLLASPRYGERWARHWLDVARYGESQGFERNKLRPSAWKYRDWVVEALNGDMPYDEFVRLQIAGDVLRPDDPLAVIASGFLVAGPYDLTIYTATSAMMMMAGREEEIEGLVGTVAQTFLGLTANCARCHDHKFDPVSQKEYYRLAAALGGTYHGAERESLTAAGKVAAERERADLAARVSSLQERLAALAPDAARERDRLRGEKERLESRARLLAGGPAHVTVPKQPAPFHVLARGDFRRKGEVVPPGGIAALAGLPADWGLAPDAPEAERRKALAAWIADPRNPLTSRVLVNRLWTGHFGAGLVPTPNDFGFNGGRPSHPELLDWLAARFAAPRSPESKVLSPESKVLSPESKVLSPEVRVSGDGYTGLRTRDSGLREAAGLGWSLKRLHRLIVTSATYRQSSQPSAAPNPQSAIRPYGRPVEGRNPQSRDSENRLLWRQNRRRLEAEAFRDAALFVSGELDLRMGGPGYRDWTEKSHGENVVFTPFDAVGPEFNRRTLYRASVRAGTSPFLDSLDCPDPSVSTPRRSETTTPQQALSLLNNRFVEHVGGKWAERLEREAPGNRRAQVSRAYRLAFGRDASEDEARFGEEFAGRHGLAQLCIILFNSNEFLYVD